MANEHRWARLLTYVTGLVNQELLLQNEYLTAENRILRAQLPALGDCPILNGPRSPRSDGDWDGRLSLRLLSWQNPIRFSAGTGDWLRPSSTAPSDAVTLADRESSVKWKPSSCASLAKTRPGATIG